MFLIVFSLLLSFNIYAQSFYEGSYYNYSIDTQLKNKLSKSDTISFDIHNPTLEKKQFYLVFEDNLSNSYWSKLNFKTTLFPGKNRLNFDLKRSLGERGSTRFERSLNYKKLKKMFVVVNPDHKKNIKYTITNLKFSLQNTLNKPVSFHLYKFQSSKINIKKMPAFSVVSEETKYNKKRGYGLTNIDVWQMRDSKIAPTYISHTISVKKANFRVKLPPGEYRYELNWNEVGYWDIPFWSQRKLKINNKTVLFEKRNSDKFLKDLFQFNKEIISGEHPYDIYFKKLLKPHSGVFKNQGEYVDFYFEGDVSAVALNTLMIWPKAKDKLASKFKNSLNQFNKNMFDQYYRPIELDKEKVSKLALSQANISNDYLPYKNCKGSHEITIVTANNGQKQFDICVSGNNKDLIDISISDLKSEGNIISSKAFIFKEYKYKYKSQDLNHETYQLASENLVEHSGKIDLNKFSTRYYNISLLGGAYKAGTYKGKITLRQGKLILKKNIFFSIINKKYKGIPLNAGVLGLNPFPKTYFQGDLLNILKDKSYDESLRLLQDIGLNQFTEIPTPYLNYKLPTYESFELVTSKTKDFVKRVKQKEIFLYNSEFPKVFFDDNERNSSQTQSEFFNNMKKELEKFKKETNKDYIYLYSDEATGYRDAVNSDLALARIYNKRFPSLMLGGFGNLYDWEKGKSLYKSWSYGFYSDIPSKKMFRKIKRNNKRFGVYNLCAENSADLSFCFGLQMYRSYKAGIKYYLEWHAAAIHNYPGLDLDGRESDIGFFYPKINGEVGITKRYIQASYGVEIFKKLILLETYLKNRKAPGQKENNAKAWLKKIMGPDIFPIKKYYKLNQRFNAKHQKKLNFYLKTFFI